MSNKIQNVFSYISNLSRSDDNKRITTVHQNISVMVEIHLLTRIKNNRDIRYFRLFIHKIIKQLYTTHDTPALKPTIKCTKHQHFCSADKRSVFDLQTQQLHHPTRKRQLRYLHCLLTLYSKPNYALCTIYTAKVCEVYYRWTVCSVRRDLAQSQAGIQSQHTTACGMFSWSF